MLKKKNFNRDYRIEELENDLSDVNEVIDELYEKEIIDNNDLNIIQNEYSSYKSKDDGFER